MANGSLLSQIANPAQANVLGALDAGKKRQAKDLAGEILGQTFTGKLGATFRLDAATGIELAKAMGTPLDSQGRQDNFVGIAIAADQLVKSGLVNEAIQFLDEEATKIESATGDSASARNIRQFIPRLQQGDEQAFAELNTLATSFRQGAAGKTAGQREFESLTSGLSEEDELKARRVKLRLDPGAVGTGAQTIAALGTAKEVGASEAIISQRKKFGELTGASRAKTIDSSFETITKINKNIRNMGRAITAIDEGASTGVIESRFFPSFRKATLQLEALQKELALDVIGSVTFGALSQGELDLAQEVALPTNLEPADLKDELTRRIAAQEKLRGYYQSQIDHLDQGGTIASFLRQQERGTPENDVIEVDF